MFRQSNKCKAQLLVHIFCFFFFFYIYVFNLNKSEDDFTNDNYVPLKIMYSASGQKLYIRN